MDPKPFALPSRKPEILEFLKNRRSNMSKFMTGPGPSEEQLNEMLMIAARVPDHRKLSPWRFIIFKDDARQKIGAHIGSLFEKQNPDMPIDRVLFEAQRFLRAPLVVGVVSSPVDCARGTPEWEQRLSSAIVCYNLCLAAQAHGFGAQWLTEWYSYEQTFCAEIGVTTPEQVTGFIYIGTAGAPSLPRPRPKLEPLITHYS
ncbi:MAG: nitroreductase [Hellea sp.]|nr:nitroreductase [Hellea sp.]